MNNNNDAFIFWNNLAKIKESSPFSSLDWKQICGEANVNYLSFRSSKYGCHLPSVSTIVQLSAFFKVSIESLVCDCGNDMEERRNRILDAVIKSKPSRYIALESLLGLSSPEIEDIE